MKTIALVGNPNVGKSVLFYHLTGNYVTVSNYPGTTVEVAHGLANVYGKTIQVYDTPGIYSVSPVTEEEAVTRRLLMENRPDVVVHVVDAKNLPRMLPLTLELISCGIPLVLVLNMMDEAEALGVRINRGTLAARLGIPVVEAAFAAGRGVNALKREIERQLAEGRVSSLRLPIPAEVQRLAGCLQGQYSLARLVIARLLLEGDKEIAGLVKTQESPENYRQCMRMTQDGAQHNVPYALAMQRRQEAQALLSGMYYAGSQRHASWPERITLHPVGGVLVTALVLYVGLYVVVGRLGAGVLVDLLERVLFGEIFIPRITAWSASLPWVAQDLLAGEFGILTMGFRYAFGIILPIVGTFFFVFAILEDSGYLPRLAYWADGLMKKIGLNGRAVIPLTLGLGCGTMAVVVTRTLETVRERVAATFLLALAIPCSAQLGLIMAVLSGDPRSLLVWALLVSVVFLAAGAALNVVLPGGRAAFFMELPPLRMPKLYAIFQKTLARLKWYFLDVIPVFVAVSVILWLLRETGLLQCMSDGLAPAAGLLGLPPQLAVVFLYGFFRRDYGAAGLFDLYRSGAVSEGQMLVAAVVLTLFLPCLAQLAMMIRERGVIVSAATALLVMALAFGTGLLLRVILGLPVL